MYILISATFVSYPFVIVLKLTVLFPFSKSFSENIRKEKNNCNGQDHAEVLINYVGVEIFR